MRAPKAALAIPALALLAAAGGAAAGPSVASLDQCADQFVLALAPRADIRALSHRAADPDSYLRAQAKGLPERRADLETLLTLHPDVVVRSWGGDAALARRLQARGVRVVKIDDATGFDGVRANVRRVAAALGQAAKGEALVRRMDAQLRAARGAWGGMRALYLTPGGFTAGKGTLIGAAMLAAGLIPAATSPGFAPVALERLVLQPPAALVLGFFDHASAQAQWWSVGRGSALRQVAKGRMVATLPGNVLGCPAWFIGDAVAAMAASSSGAGRGTT